MVRTPAKCSLQGARPARQRPMLAWKTSRQEPTGYSGLAEVDSQTCEPEETGVSSMAGNDGCENQLALMPENPDNLDVSQQAVAEAEPSCVAALMPAAEVGQQDSFPDTYVEVEPISAPARPVPPVSQPVSPVVPGSKPASSEVAPSKPASSKVAPSKPASSMVARSKPSSSQVAPSKPASSVVAPKKAASPVPPSTVPPCQAAGPVAVPSLDDENEALSEEDEPNLPPPTPSDAAIEARLRRIFKPRADGT